jgi:hypothetical protein
MQMTDKTKNRLKKLWDFARKAYEIITSPLIFMRSDK